MQILQFILKFFKSIKTILITLILSLIVIFMINNRETIQVDFYPISSLKIETRVFIIMLTLYLIGFFSAIFIYSSKFFKSSFVNYKQKQQIKKLQAKIENQK